MNEECSCGHDHGHEHHEHGECCHEHGHFGEHSLDYASAHEHGGECCHDHEHEAECGCHEHHHHEHGEHCGCHEHHHEHGEHCGCHEHHHEHGEHCGCHDHEHHHLSAEELKAAALHERRLAEADAHLKKLQELHEKIDDALERVTHDNIGLLLTQKKNLKALKEEFAAISKLAPFFPPQILMAEMGYIKGIENILREAARLKREG